MQHSPGFLKLVEGLRAEVTELSIENILPRMNSAEKLVIIDCREDSEWALSHIPKAIHLGRGIIERDIEAQVPDPSTPIVIYCGGGYRSILAAHNLGKMGYSQVISMQEGFRGWTERQLPLISSSDSDT
ncbi:MAG: rhodanese-like domain-containing protein [Proteobacteria bacterium]|nr:rhodanese-like domain-containing protein [Pseudomonadota bacterium]